MRDSFPFPSASNVPQYTILNVEIKNPRLMIRRAVTPLSIRAESASNRDKICTGKARAATVPSAIKMAVKRRL